MFNELASTGEGRNNNNSKINSSAFISFLNGQLPRKVSRFEDLDLLITTYIQDSQNTREFVNFLVNLDVFKNPENLANLQLVQIICNECMNILPTLSQIHFNPEELCYYIRISEGTYMIPVSLTDTLLSKYFGRFAYREEPYGIIFGLIRDLAIKAGYKSIWSNTGKPEGYYESREISKRIILENETKTDDFILVYILYTRLKYLINNGIDKFLNIKVDITAPSKEI